MPTTYHPAKCHFQTAKKSEYCCVLYRNAYDYLINHSVREMHDDRKMKEEIESTGGEVGKGGGVNGNVAEAQWNYINLSKCI